MEKCRANCRKCFAFRLYLQNNENHLSEMSVEQLTVGSVLRKKEIRIIFHRVFFYIFFFFISTSVHSYMAHAQQFLLKQVENEKLILRMEKPTNSNPYY